MIVLALSPSTIGSEPCGYLDRRSSPANQPPKWKGIQVTPLPTRSVTSAFIFALALFSAPVTQTQPPSLIPRSAASAGLISMNMSCCSSASHLLERVSSPPPSYSTRRPDETISGNALAMPLSTALFCTEKPIFGSLNCFASGNVGYCAIEIDARRINRLAMHRDWIGQIPGDRPRLAVAVGRTTVLDRDALDAAGKIRRPRHRVDIVGAACDFFDGRQFCGRKILVPAQFLEDTHREFRIAVLNLRTRQI